MLAPLLQAFAQAVALQLFVLRQASGAAQLASAAGAAAAGLAAAAAALAGYARQFLAVAGTAAAAGESHALLQRCQATLGSAAAHEQQLTVQAEQGRAALAAVLANAQPVAAHVLASLQECKVRACHPPQHHCSHLKLACVASHCSPEPSLGLPICLQAWQQRHDALLPLLLNSPPAALLARPAAVDPAAAAEAAAAAGVPPLLLLLVTSPGGMGGDAGSGSLLHAALGILPSHAPLSASLLLLAAATDAQGQQLLAERSAAAQQLAAALRQYAAAAACLLGGQRYAGSSQHAHWLAAFQAAMDLPVPQVRHACMHVCMHVCMHPVCPAGPASLAACGHMQE